jgi:hypothetical protein
VTRENTNSLVWLIAPSAVDTHAVFALLLQ